MNFAELTARIPLYALQIAALFSVFCACVLAARALVGSEAQVLALRAAYRGLHDELTSALRAAAVQTSARAILVTQASAIASILIFGVRVPYALFALPFVVWGPRVVLQQLRKRRIARIEQKLDVFGLLLANALRASPSIGKAFAQIAEGVPKPLDEEVAQLLREVHVGSTLEDALLQLSARVGSFQLDTMLSGLLIGRRVGGNVPEVLETAAATLREMHRLEGVLSAKTAEGRVQATMLAAMPVLIVFLFETVRPGYFDVLGNTSLGMLVSAAALGMWLLSIIAARRILEVEL